MIKVLFIFALLFLTLNARENPFFPSAGEKDILLTTNEESLKVPLKQAAISFPTQARVLQKVTIEFKNLDGSVETKSIELDNSIDWHLPLFISQSYIETPSTAQQKPAALVTPAIQKKSVQKEGKYENIVSLPFLKLSVSQKSLKLITGDEALRNFLLANPHRIVVDFKSDSEIEGYTKKESDSIFKEVRVGNHKGYYRVVVELDGLYKYGFEKIAEGYLVELR